MSMICPTCLSTPEKGAKLTEVLKNFLCKVLHFKFQLLENSQQIICRVCYKTLIELKCFYSQLRDVETYLQSQIENISSDSKPNQIVNEIEENEPYLSGLECTVSIADEAELDPILIDENEDYTVAEDEKPKKKQKVTEKSSGKRYVCLTCSRFFGKVSELRRHEKTAHSSPKLQNASPVFLPASPHVSQTFTCLVCGKGFFNKIVLDAHIRQNHSANQKQSTKPLNFFCEVCQRTFLSKALLRKHQCCFECEICRFKNSSFADLQTHMNEKHRDINGTFTQTKIKKENEIIIAEQL